MKNKTLNYLVEATQATEYILLDVTNKFRRQVYSIIAIMQEGVGYVAFNDETSFPHFEDYSGEMAEDIVAVRVMYDIDNYPTLQLCTDASMIEDSKGWFNANVWGNYDVQEIFNCLKGVWEQNNK